MSAAITTRRKPGGHAVGQVGRDHPQRDARAARERHMQVSSSSRRRRAHSTRAGVTADSGHGAGPSSSPPSAVRASVRGAGREGRHACHEVSHHADLRGTFSNVSSSAVVVSAWVRRMPVKTRLAGGDDAGLDVVDEDALGRFERRPGRRRGRRCAASGLRMPTSPER